MKQFLGITLVVVYFPVLVYSQLTCHRCYGSGYCNDGSHEDFISDERIATCNVSMNSISNLQINNSVLNNVQNALNGMILKDTNDNTANPASVTTGHCITATVQEPHATHTLRTCITRTTLATNNQTLCELINEIIDPLNWYQGNFSCLACNNADFCNNHTLLAGNDTPPSGGDTTPSGGDTTPSDGDTTPSGGDTTPSGGDTLVVSSVILACSLILSVYKLNL